MKTRTIYRIASPGTNPIIGEGESIGEAWADAAHTEGSPIEELEETCWALEVEQEYDEETMNWEDVSEAAA